MADYATCTHVTPQCPIDATTYGYRPNLAGNVFLLVIFATCTVLQVALGIWSRLRAFGIVVAIGCLAETVGYGGRLIMHANPWSSAGFKIQIVCLILAPSFLAAGLYLTLKHLALTLGPQASRLQPRLYTWIFISCDAFSIVLQAAGGGVAAAESVSLVNDGDDIMITGIAFQVATMSICLLLAADFAFRLTMSSREDSNSMQEEKGDKEDEAYNPSTRRKFRFYLVCSSIAFLAIYVRSIYRIPEMAGGWGNPLMQDEEEFLILDGAMIALASILLTIAHPGIFFPAMKR